MKQPEKVVITVDELIAATKDAKCEQIAIRSKLTNVPSVRLSPGQSLRGIGVRAGITFVEGADGLQLSSNNKIRNIDLTTSPNKRAIFNDTNIDTLGRIELRGVTAIGQIQIVARNKVRGGHVIVDGVDIVSADARGQTERPIGYGVNVIQGAFTLWNQHSDPAIVVTAELRGISAGRNKAPVLGSGVFVGGGGDNGGRLNATLIETGEIFSDGKNCSGNARSDHWWRVCCVRRACEESTKPEARDHLWRERHGPRQLGSSR